MEKQSRETKNNALKLMKSDSSNSNLNDRNISIFIYNLESISIHIDSKSLK